MSGATVSDATDDALTVLAALVDDASRAQVRAVAGALGARVLLARTVDETLAFAAREPIDLAIVDVGIDGGAGLALVHHIPALRPDARTVAVAHRADLAYGADALAVGADTLHLLPLAGDTIATAISAVRARRLDTRERHALAATLDTARATRKLYDRVMSALAAGEREAAATLLLDGLVASGVADGLALYSSQLGEATRLATTGSLADAPALTNLEALAAGAHGSLAPLRQGGAVVGALVLSGASGTPTSVLDLATLLVAKPREGPNPAAYPHEVPLVTEAEFLATAGDREVERARRYGRRLSTLILRGGSASARAARAELRSSDVIARLAPDEVVVLLPEADAFGASACRRRLASRLHAVAHDAGEVATEIAFGAATFPHCGSSLGALVRAARARARITQLRGAQLGGAHELPLGELVDTLARNSLARFPRVVPLDVTLSALVALTEQLCAEALRGGLATYLATDLPGRSLKAPARALLALGVPPRTSAPRGRDARPERRATASPASSVELRNVHHLPGCEDVLVIVLRAEHATWATCGRLERDRFVGVHTRDPRLADLLTERLEEGERRRDEEPPP